MFQTEPESHIFDTVALNGREQLILKEIYLYAEALNLPPTFDEVIDRLNAKMYPGPSRRVRYWRTQIQRTVEGLREKGLLVDPENGHRTRKSRNLQLTPYGRKIAMMIIEEERREIDKAAV